MRLMHPLHGWHFASSADDVAAMRRAGWVDDDGKAIAEKLSATGVVAAKVAVEAPAVVKRGPGRPRKVAADGA